MKKNLTNILLATTISGVGLAEGVSMETFYTELQIGGLKQITVGNLNVKAYASSQTGEDKKNDAITYDVSLGDQKILVLYDKRPFGEGVDKAKVCEFGFKPNNSTGIHCEDLDVKLEPVNKIFDHLSKNYVSLMQGKNLDDNKEITEAYSKSIK